MIKRLFLVGILLLFPWALVFSLPPMQGGPSGNPAPYTVASPVVPQAPRRQATAEYALVISIDGLGWQTFQTYKAASPLLSGLAKKGVACPMEAVFPSVTWASHASLVTGQYPRKHGILGNRWLEDYETLIHPYEKDPVDPERAKRTPSLYDLAHKQGWITAAINWPATQGATTLHYNWPEVMHQGDIAYRLLSDPLRELLRDLYDGSHSSLSSGLKTLLRPSPDHLEPFFNRLAVSEVNDTDMLVADLTSELVFPQKTSPRPLARPRLMLTHFLTMDSWFHKYGPTPLIAQWALRHIDLYLRQILDAYKKAGILDKTIVLVTSDHGFHPIRKEMDLRALWAKHKLTTSTRMDGSHREKAKILTFYNGHAAYVYVRPTDRPRLLAKMLNLLRKPPYKACVQDIYFPSEYHKLGLPIPSESEDSLPEDPARPLRPRSAPQKGRPSLPLGSPSLWKHNGSPTFIVLSKPDCAFRAPLRRREIIQPVDRSYKESFSGNHGYLPNHPSMKALFLASGPGIRPEPACSSRSKNLRTVDVAPTLAYLLGLSWPREWGSLPKRPLLLDGKVLNPLLK